MITSFSNHIFNNAKCWIDLLKKIKNIMFYQLVTKPNKKVLSISDETKQKSYNYSDREKEIENQFINFPPGLENIIIEYDVCEFKKSMIKFDTVSPEEPKEIKYITEYHNDMSYYFSMCKNLISGVTKLNNNNIITGTFTGLICIWNPDTGKCIKKIKSMEKSIAKIKKVIHRGLTICQVFDDIIAVCANDHESSNVYIISIDFDIIHEIDNNNGNICFHHILPIPLNRMAVVSYVKNYHWSEQNTVTFWDIKKEYNDTKVTLYKTHELQFNYFLSSTHIGLKKDLIIILGKTNDRNNILILVDINTKKQINLIEFRGKVISQPSIIDNNLLISYSNHNKVSHKMINRDTFQQTDVLDQINDCIYKTIKIKKNTFLISTIRHSPEMEPEMEPEISDIQIYIFDMLTQSIIQIIQTEYQSIRDICECKYGFLTLTSTFQINTYDCL